MDRLGLAETGAVRLGIVHYLSENDVDRVVEGLRADVAGEQKIQSRKIRGGFWWETGMPLCFVWWFICVLEEK